jgi:hypothetical protein
VGQPPFCMADLDLAAFRRKRPKMLKEIKTKPAGK